MNTDMKITVNPGMEHLRQFVRQLPELFPVSGEVLHDGRNQIRAFDIGSERLVVKRYKRPSAPTNTPCACASWKSTRPNPSHGANTAATG